MMKILVAAVACLMDLCGPAAEMRPSVPAPSLAGEISGTVLDSGGEPISGLTVIAERLPEGGSYDRSGTVTDDKGRYRVAAEPGRHQVKVGGCPRGTIQPCPADAPIYIYYPGTKMQARARLVSIERGASRGDVNFFLDRADVAALLQEGARLQAVAGDLWVLRRDAPAPSAGWNSLEAMHKHYVASFVATPGMGSGRMGPLQMQIDPEQRLLLSGEQAQWSVKDLDLIGIAKHEQPVVFSRLAHGVYGVSDRKLTAFERQSLASLQKGKEIVSGRADAGAMVVIGAIPAESACIRCHRTETVGGLLGAFRYVLRRS